uniref:Putative salivary kunitz domain protein n=1 Tax=Ixodes ricinus TaxID=34613 RepID=A0A0K8RHT0_IXORI
MRAFVCFLHFGVAWIAIASWYASSSAEDVSGMNIYEFESWVSCLDPDKVTCKDQSGTHASYNRSTGMCEEKNGTDCEGGENNFESMKRCNESCNNAPKPPCSLEEDYGVGRAYHERWYFNTSTANCTRFIWGGISKNENNFDTLEKCLATCNGFSLLKKVNVTINGSSP